MKKRGQVFILAAIILVLVIFLLISQSNVIRKKLFIDKFEDITKNYETEGNKLINSILSENPENVAGKFEIFSDNFVSYNVAQDPTLGTIYVLNYQDKTDVGVYNMMNVEVRTDVSSQPQGCISEYDATVEGETGGSSFTIPSECKLNYKDINKIIITTADSFIYIFDIEAGKPQLNMVVKKSGEEETRVYYKNE